MALVSSSHSDHRIYEPSIECDYPTRQEQSELRSRLLAKIDNAYRKALERLDFRARPSMAARFLYGGGFCFGLLDPVSNIVANTLIPYECGREEDTAGIVTERKLRELEHRSLEGMLTFLTRFFPYLAECEAVRYLLLADADVLVAARIIALDRHMKNFGIFNQGRVVEDAFNMALKCAALAARHPEPDLVVRVWLHISAAPHSILNLLSRVRRRSPVPKNITDLFTGLSRVSTQQKSTGFSLVSTESQQKSSSESQQKSTSLSMASTEPQQKSIGVSMDSTKSQLKNASMSMVSTKSQQESSMYKPWNLAAWRRPRRCSVPYQHTTALKRILLDAIHGFYLKALTLLPAGELQSRYHRSLLTAGHCYGPLDPVSNIILNTIWYDAAFPPTHELEMDMVSSLSLHRIENRSLYGMISFLCTRFHHLDFHQAACCLLHADANLLGADPNLDAVAAAALRRQVSLGEDYLCPWSGYSFKWSTTAGFPTALGRVDGLDKSPDTSVNEAFKAAAIAARHPNPDDQVSLLASCKQKLGSALSLLQAGHPLSSKDVQQLAILLRPESSRSEQPLLPFPLKEYMHEHARISKKVNAVLNASMQMANGEPLYQVHIICGVNSQVSGPVYCPGGSKFAPHKCLQIHVNFIATLRETDSRAGGKKVLFFAELSNDDEDGAGAQSFCCPVPKLAPCAERVRCLYCDYVGIRIVHPDVEDFHGRKQEFEKMVCGEDPCDEDFDPAVNRTIFNNLSLIRHSRLVANQIGNLEEDFLYASSFDEPKHDARFVDIDLFMDDDDACSHGSLTDDFDVSD